MDLSFQPAIGVPHCGKTRRGSTMADVMIMVAFLSATATVAMFQISSRPPVDDARLVSQSIADALKQAREMATRKDVYVTVKFDSTSQPSKWRFEATAGPLTPPKQWEIAVPAGVVVDGTLAPIRIDAGGNANSSGKWSIRGNVSYEVTLDSIRASVMVRGTGGPT